MQKYMECIIYSGLIAKHPIVYIYEFVRRVNI